MRIASLLPAATEIVCALGRGDRLVGVSHECDHPPEVRGLPALTRSRLGAPGASAAIDRDLRRLLGETLSVYEVLADELARVAPDVIVTQELCDVCAVSFADVKDAARRLCAPGTEIVSLSPERLADVFADVARVGAALDAGAEAEALLAALRARVEAVRATAAGAAHRPVVLSLEWIAPVMVGGLWTPELIELAGGRPLAARAGEHAPTLTDEQLAALDPAPEVVLVKPCGFPLARTLAEADALRKLLGRFDWPAVRAGRVWLADGNAYFNRPGPRVVDSLELLAACVHPERFPEHAARYAGAMRRLELV